MNNKEIDYLYKYMSFEQFVDMIENKRLYLTHIKEWEDTHEGAAILHEEMQYLKEKGYSGKLRENEQYVLIEDIINRIYAQSWGKNNSESDAMWRIYSSNRTGVRIKVRREMITHEINKIVESNAIYQCFKEGDVEYIESMKDIDFSKYYTETKIEDTNITQKNLDCGGLCFYKRDAFRHEEEYRYVLDYEKNRDKEFKIDFKNIISSLKSYNYPPVIYYNIEYDYIDEILLDPRAAKYFVETFEAYCNNRNLSNYGIVFQQSSLYTL